MFGSVHDQMQWRLWLTIVLGCVAILLVSAYTTYVEARYLIAGRTSTGSITGVDEMKPAKRDGEPFLRVKYSFADVDGTNRKESDDMSADWVVPASSSVSVQFLQGKPGWSRIAGHNRLLLTLPFCVSLLIVVVFLLRFYREFREHERRKASW